MKKLILTAFCIWFQIVAIASAETTITQLDVWVSSNQHASTLGRAIFREPPTVAEAEIIEITTDQPSVKFKVLALEANGCIKENFDAKIEKLEGNQYLFTAPKGNYRVWILAGDDDETIDVAIGTPPIGPPPIVDDLQALIDAIDAAAEPLNDPDTRVMMASGYAAVAAALESGGQITASYAGETHNYDVTTIEIAKLALAEKAREAMWNRKDQSKNWFQFRKTASKLVSDAIGDNPTKERVVQVLQAVSVGLSEET